MYINFLYKNFFINIYEKELGENMSTNYNYTYFNPYWNESLYENNYSSTNNQSNSSSYSSIFDSYSTTLSNFNVDYSKGYSGILTDYYDKVNAYKEEQEKLEAEREAQEEAAAQEAQENNETDETADVEETNEVDEQQDAQETDEAQEDNQIYDEQDSGELNANYSNNSSVEHDCEVRENFDAEEVAKSLHDAAQLRGQAEMLQNSIFRKYFYGLEGEYEALNNAELNAVAQAYNEMYCENLDSVLEDIFSYDTENELVSKLRNATEVIEYVDDDGNSVSKYLGEIKPEDISDDLLKKLATKYDAATVDKWGTDENAVWQIMSLDPEVLNELIEYYDNSARADIKSFGQTLKDEFFMTFGRGKILEKYKNATGNDA